MSFKKIIQNWKVSKGCPFTFTLLSGGKIYVSKDDSDIFFDAFIEAVNNGEIEGTDLQQSIPNDGLFRFFIDLDGGSDDVS
jgi:hypothetical protein